MKRLERALGQAGKLGQPKPLPVASPEHDVPEKLAFCPIIERKCALVDCGSCRALATDLEEVSHAWACSLCARTLPTGWTRRTYWKDGECSFCGEYSIVLTLLVHD